MDSKIENLKKFAPSLLWQMSADAVRRTALKLYF